MVAATLMLVVLVCSYLAMIALVNFAEHVIERPRLAKRDHRFSGSSQNRASH
jgi:Tfp pilus assembly protein FimT